LDPSNENNPSTPSIKRGRTKSTTPEATTTNRIKRQNVHNNHDKLRFGGSSTQSPRMSDNKLDPDTPNEQTAIRLQSENHFKSYLVPFKLQTKLNNCLSCSVTRKIEKVFINKHNNQLYLILDNKHAETIKKF